MVYGCNFYNGNTVYYGGLRCGGSVCIMETTSLKGFNSPAVVCHIFNPIALDPRNKKPIIYHRDHEQQSMFVPNEAKSRVPVTKECYNY